jgi:hypothetical protein
MVVDPLEVWIVTDLARTVERRGVIVEFVRFRIFPNNPFPVIAAHNVSGLSAEYAHFIDSVAKAPFLISHTTRVYARY